jgi:hypothetical protein
VNPRYGNPVAGSRAFVRPGPWSPSIASSSHYAGAQQAKKYPTMQKVPGSLPVSKLKPFIEEQEISGIGRNKLSALARVFPTVGEIVSLTDYQVLRKLRAEGTGSLRGALPSEKVMREVYERLKYSVYGGERSGERPAEQRARLAVELKAAEKGLKASEAEAQEMRERVASLAEHLTQRAPI